MSGGQTDWKRFIPRKRTFRVASVCLFSYSLDYIYIGFYLPRSRRAEPYSLSAELSLYPLYPAVDVSWDYDASAVSIFDFQWPALIAG